MERVRDFLADPRSRVASTGTNRSAVPDHAEQATGTQPLGVVGNASAPAVPVSPRAGSRRSRRPPTKVLLGGLALLLSAVLAATLYVGLSGDEPAQDNTASPPETASSPSAGPSQDAEAKPTEQGIEAFIRDYVATVASNPDASWQMLTPKFQVESGGIDTYRRFWDRATNGRVLSISANPDDLSVSYQVRFDNFDNGPGPTVLDLKFDRGRYLIDGERTQGFVPAD
jgi:hypothetical protein